MSRRNRYIYTPPPKPPVDPALLSPMVQIGQVLIKHDLTFKHSEGDYRSFRKSRRCIVVSNRGEESAKHEAERAAKYGVPSNVTIVQPFSGYEWDWWTVIFDDDLDRATYTSNEAPKPDNVDHGDWRKNWTITDEIVSQEAVAERIAARKAMLEDERRREQERQEALRQSYECDYFALVVRLQDESPWATADHSYSPGKYDYKRVAKNLRAELKTKFPRVKFAIQYARNFMIEWYLGPERAEVEALTEKYLNPHGTSGRYSDGQSADRSIYDGSPTGCAYGAVFGRADEHSLHCIRYDEAVLAKDRTELERIRHERPGDVKAIRYYERLLKLAGEEAAR